MGEWIRGFTVARAQHYRSLGKMHDKEPVQAILHRTVFQMSCSCLARRLGIGGHGRVESSSQRGSKENRNGSGTEGGEESLKHYNGIFSWEGNIVYSPGKKETEGAGALLLRMAGSMGKRFYNERGKR